MTTSQTPDQLAFAGTGKRRPVLGLTLLGISVISTISVLIFFGAWFSEDRIEARTLDGTVLEAEGEWWEDGLIAVCPIH